METNSKKISKKFLKMDWKKEEKSAYINIIQPCLLWSLHSCIVGAYSSSSACFFLLRYRTITNKKQTKSSFQAIKADTVNKYSRCLYRFLGVMWTNNRFFFSSLLFVFLIKPKTWLYNNQKKKKSPGERQTRGFSFWME